MARPSPTRDQDRSLPGDHGGIPAVGVWAPSWFLLGGDLYTAYTLIAVPALVYATGAAGFFALSYTIMVFPIVFVFAPRLWSVSRAHNYVTPADFVRGRYGSRGLALAIAFTASSPPCRTSRSSLSAWRRCSR